MQQLETRIKELYDKHVLLVDGNTIEYRADESGWNKLVVPFMGSYINAFRMMVLDFGLLCAKLVTDQQPAAEKTAVPPPSSHAFSTVVRTGILDQNGAPYSLTFSDGPLAHQIAALLKETYERGVADGYAKRTGNK